VVEDAHGVSVLGDPTEGALLVAGAKAGLDRKHLLEEHRIVGEVPFSSTRMLMATFHQANGVLTA
jgi:Ca2+-transporting ATPase